MEDRLAAFLFPVMFITGNSEKALNPLIRPRLADIGAQRL